MIKKLVYIIIQLLYICVAKSTIIFKEQDGPIVFFYLVFSILIVIFFSTLLGEVIKFLHNQKSRNRFYKRGFG